MEDNQLIRLTRPSGVVLWLVVAATVLEHRSGAGRFGLWAACWGAGFAFSLAASFLPLPRFVALTLLGLEGLAVAAMTALLCNGFEGLLLVPMALELSFRLPTRGAWLWVAAQTVLFGAAVAWHWNGWSGWMLALPYGAVQAVVLAASAAFHRERALKNDLKALGPVLEAGSRNAERVRLARELHDATGHRLTALALQLEVAVHAAEGAGRARIETAQGVVRELIDDMHRIVEATELTDSEGLATALRALARDFPRPVVHLALPDRLRVADAERAHVLLRCSQEILTNCARHSGAQNLWLEITQSEAELKLHARDDGVISDGVTAGAGLKGMRGRIEGLGGSLSYQAAPQGGLQLVACLPNPAPA